MLKTFIQNTLENILLSFLPHSISNFIFITFFFTALFLCYLPHLYSTRDTFVLFLSNGSILLFYFHSKQEMLSELVLFCFLFRPKIDVAIFSYSSERQHFIKLSPCFSRPPMSVRTLLIIFRFMSIFIYYFFIIIIIIIIIIITVIIIILIIILLSRYV